jgi:hypothetical protein
MSVDQLIDDLSRDLRPVGKRAVGKRLLAGLAVGAVGTLALVGWWLGFNPDLGLAMRGYSFWMKWAYSLSIAACALIATMQLARPDVRRQRWLWVLTVPAGLLTLAAIVEMARSAPAKWLSMWLGDSWQICPTNVFLLSIPIFLGLLWSFRKMAPTRLRAAGAAAGLTAGAGAATLYCLHCPEVSALFVLCWYSLGIGLTTLLGALVGPRLLRW